MVKLTLMTTVSRPLEDVSQGMTRELLESFQASVSSQFLSMRVVRFDGLQIGDEVHLEFVPSVPRSHPLKWGEMRWVSVITERSETATEISYTDEALHLPYPLKFWRHRHRMIRTPTRETAIRDEISYSTGHRSLDLLIYPLLKAHFSARHPIYKRVFSKMGN